MSEENHRSSKIFSITFLILLLQVPFCWGIDPKGEEPSRRPKVISKGAKILSSLKYPEIHWKVPEVGLDVKRVELENGMVLYLMEDHDLPLIHLQAIIRTGSLYEPEEKAGLADLTGEVIRTGGTQDLSGDDLDRELESIACNLSTSIGIESGEATLNCLVGNFDRALDLFSQVLRNPRFEEEKINLAKKEIEESIRRENDNPGTILSWEFSRLIYGNHPYGRSPKLEPISKISRQDLIDFHKRYFHPNNILLGITGDFKEEEMIQKINTLLGDWKPESIKFPEVPKVNPQFKDTLLFIPKELNQSNIRIGHLGVDRSSPDIYAITLMNFILGGGSFASRMTERIRSDEGLAYSVGSRFDTESQDLGVFYATCQTKTESTQRAIDIILEEIRKIREVPVEVWELELAKEVYINRYIFNWTSAASMVRQLMLLEYSRRPRDFFETYLEKLNHVSREDILRVAQIYLHPDRLSIVIVGDSN